MYVIGTVHPAHVLRGNRRLSGTVELGFKRAYEAAYMGKRPKWVEKEFILKPDAGRIETALRSMHGTAVAFDVETDGEHSCDNQLRCIGFYNGRVGITVPLLYRDGTREDVPVKDKKGNITIENRAVWKPYFTGAVLERVVAAIRAVLQKASKLYTQNGQYDRTVVKKHFGVEVKAGDTGMTFDSMVCHHVIAPYLPHGLGFLTALYTPCPFYKATEDGDAWSSGTDHELWLYCLRDCKNTWLICEQMQQELVNDYPNAPTVYEQDMWQEAECQRWREVGVEVDRRALRYFQFHYSTVRDRALGAMRKLLEKRAASASSFNEDYEVFTALLEKLAGKADEESVDDTGALVEHFNPASLIELRMMLSGLGIKLTEVTATGQLSTAKEILTGARKALLSEGVPPEDDRIAFLDYLFAWRESAKVIGTYLYPEILKDGRVHPTFSVHVVPTGRLSSKAPNYQNQPAEIRGMFVARGWTEEVVARTRAAAKTPKTPKHVLVSMDWDALEMRLGAFLSGDPTYIKVFREYDAKTGPKPHHANMAAIFGLPPTKQAAEQNPGMYRAAKVFAYAVAYGAGEDTVFEQVREELPDMDFATFKVAFDRYKATYPVLFEFQRAVVKQGSTKGFIESGLIGRRMFFFEQAFAGESSPEATAMQNAPYQSTGADIVGAANRRIMDRLVLPLRTGVMNVKSTKEERRLIKSMLPLKPGEVIEQLAQVHDELVFEVPERIAETFMKVCKAIAEEKPKKLVNGKWVELDWNLPVDIHADRRWKPVQARCHGQHKDGSRCRELVDIDFEKETKTADIWAGECEACKTKKRIEVPRAA